MELVGAGRIAKEKTFKCVEKEPVEPGGTRGGTGWIAKGCKELKESGRELKGAYGVGRRPTASG